MIFCINIKALKNTVESREGQVYFFRKYLIFIIKIGG